MIKCWSVGNVLFKRLPILLGWCWMCACLCERACLCEFVSINIYASIRVMAVLSEWLLWSRLTCAHQLLLCWYGMDQDRVPVPYLFHSLSSSLSFSFSSFCCLSLSLSRPPFTNNNKKWMLLCCPDGIII